MNTGGRAALPASAAGDSAGAWRVRVRLLRVATWKGRLRGLLWRGRPRPGVGLWLLPCRAVHTFGMRYPLDIVFLDRKRRVVSVVRGLAPRRAALCLRAASVVELEAGVIAFENGGVGRIEAAVQNAARGDVHGDLDGVDQGGRKTKRYQGAGAEIDAQEYRRPGQPVNGECPLVAPACDAREEQRLHQPHVVPGDQHGRMPEQRRDNDVQRTEHQQRRAQRFQERRQVAGDGGCADAFGQFLGEGHEGDQAGDHAKRRVQRPKDKQLFQDAGFLQRLEPHRRQHGAVGIDVFAGGQRHEGDDGHHADEKQRADRRREGCEKNQQADRQRPREQGQRLAHEQPEPVACPLPTGRCR
ncbi:hypothetical protein CAL13_13585 [Bordetella genomosp. 9]|uniref:DUF192 domain-containing protein n=1 Tax=Bordetella genomosp. 9 TaxID=1416803 RepID=A0A1W6Z5T5_9BORD|nr:hypothetical protein CAL13_13585 [Bordetella genomosp. 9]